MRALSMTAVVGMLALAGARTATRFFRRTSTFESRRRSSVTQYLLTDSLLRRRENEQLSTLVGTLPDARMGLVMLWSRVRR